MLLAPSSSLPSCPSASKYKNIPCPTFADITAANRALTSLDISSNNLAPYVGNDKYDMSGITALAAAIPECK